MKFEMIIFDLDGTLWNTEECTYKSVNEVLKKYNIDEEISIEKVRSAMGTTFSETAENYMPYLKKEDREELLQEILDNHILLLSKSGGNVYPNVEKALKELSISYKLAIVSNCAGGYIETFLETSGLEKYFVDFAAAAQLKISKAEAIKKVINENNVNSAIYVGDTQKDFEASQGAEIDFIHAKYGFGKNLEFEYGINSLEELPEILNNIENVRKS